MDTILRDVPMPKIFLATELRDNRTYRVVIDGQQRLSAILAFLRDEFSLQKPYSGSDLGKLFSELDQTTRDRFLLYKIDFNEANGPSEDEVREVYHRVNKYTVPLNKQELRRADFPGAFLDLSEELALHPFFDDLRIFTPANRRRYADVEYTSELVVAVVDEIQDGKTNLDHFYQQYADWGDEGQSEIRSLFDRVFSESQLVFSGRQKIAETRFRQKADFYSYFVALSGMVRAGKTVVGKDCGFLQEDLELLDYHIKPESDIPICSEYAIKCVSQANSSSSRRWRAAFMNAVLSGTYLGCPPAHPDAAYVFYGLLQGVHYADTIFCPPEIHDCPICEEEIEGGVENCVMGWRRDCMTFQVCNARWVHPHCRERAPEYVFIDRPNREQLRLL